MKKPGIIAAFVFLAFLSACASPRLKKEARWDGVPAAEAAEMKAGKFKLPLPRLYDLTQFMLEKDGFVVEKRDLVNALLKTAAWTEPGSDDQNVLKAVFKSPDGDKGSSQVTWKHYKVVRYRLKFQGGEVVEETPDEKDHRRKRESRGDYTEPVEHYASLDQAYQDTLNQDMNWRLYQAITDRLIPAK